MSDNDHYRRQAEYARTEAERATNPRDKASWLDLMQGWLSLLPKSAMSPEQRFDERARAEGTHQDISEQKQ
jgi:hypothetical protein